MENIKDFGYLVLNISLVLKGKYITIGLLKTAYSDRSCTSFCFIICTQLHWNLCRKDLQHSLDHWVAVTVLDERDRILFGAFAKIDDILAL